MLKRCCALLMTVVLLAAAVSAGAEGSPLVVTLELGQSEFIVPEEVDVTVRVTNTDAWALPGPITLYDPNGEQVLGFGQPQLGGGESIAWSGKWMITQEMLNKERVAFSLQWSEYDDGGDIVTRSTRYTGRVTLRERSLLSGDSTEPLLVHVSAEVSGLTSFPAAVRVRISVTNMTDLPAQRVTVASGETTLYTFDEIGPGETRSMTREVLIDGPGRYQFTARSGSVGNEAISSNVLTFTKASSEPEMAPATREQWRVQAADALPMAASRVTMTRQEAMYGGMLLVNEWHARPADFDETGLVGLSSYSSRQILVKDASMKLFPDAAKALWDLVLAGRAAGYDNFVVYDSYRSWDAQNELFQRQVASIKAQHPDHSEQELLESARRSVNEPGCSVYNAGNTFRITLYKMGDVTVNSKVFFESEEGLWFLEHCWEYGIVFRFPLANYPVKGTEDKSWKTGVSTQLQTFAYVGRGNARAMWVLDMCLEEYEDHLIRNPRLAIYEGDELRYVILRESVGSEKTFTVIHSDDPAVKRQTTCLDNMGGAITVLEY